MKKRLWIIAIGLSSHLAWADTSLPFPTTEAEIVKALTPKPIYTEQGRQMNRRVEFVTLLTDTIPKKG